MINRQQRDDLVEIIDYLFTTVLLDSVVDCQHHVELVQVHDKKKLGPWVDLHMNYEDCHDESP